MPPQTTESEPNTFSAYQRSSASQRQQSFVQPEVLRRCDDFSTGFLDYHWDILALKHLTLLSCGSFSIDGNRIYDCEGLVLLCLRGFKTFPVHLLDVVRVSRTKQVVARHSDLNRRRSWKV